MRILFLTQTYPRFAGDTSGPFIRDLARGLVAGGDEVTVLTPHAPGVARRWDDGGVAVESFRYAPVRYESLGYSRSLAADEKVRGAAAAVAPPRALGPRAALRHALGQQRYDLLHAHWVVPNGLVAAPFARRVPLAIGLHGSDVFLAERRGVRSLVGRALRRSRALTGCSAELVDRVCALGFPRERARLIPYGVDPRAFGPDRTRRSLWRQRLKIPASAPVVLGVGRMATKKGFHVLVDALPSVVERFPEAHFVLAGGGDRLAELERRAAPWAPRVHFPGAVRHDELPDLYRAADLFVLPAVHDPKGNVDGLPNVILEAMASALPVVASGISGIPLAVENGRTGRLVPEGDAAALAAAMIDLLADPERARAWGAAAREKVERELTWTAVAARYRAAYEEALIS